MDKNEEGRRVMVDERDLMMALDHLDDIAPDVQQEEWYNKLSQALDSHLKPRAIARVRYKPTRH